MLSLNAEVLTLALRTVSAEERTMFERWYVHGEAAGYIAAACGITTKNLYTTIARLLETLFIPALAGRRRRGNAKASRVNVVDGGHFDFDSGRRLAARLDLMRQGSMRPIAFRSRPAYNALDW